MPKRSSKKPAPQRPDTNQIAARILREATGEEPKTPAVPLKDNSGKNPAAVELGRLGGLKGGKARAGKLSPKKRSEIAKRAAKTRWHEDGHA